MTIKEEKQTAYEMTLPKGRVILLGRLSEGDVAFIQKWLYRIEAAEQTRAPDQPKAVAQTEVDGKLVEIFDSGAPHVSAGR